MAVALAARRLRPLAGARTSAILVVAGLLLAGALVRALRFGGPFRFLYHWDETALALPALDILQGTFALHFLGFEYMGSAPAYPLAAWFALAGGSPLALDLFAYAVGLAMLGSGYLLARRLYPAPDATVVLAVLAVPPVFLAARSLDGSLAYQGLLVLGNLFLAGTAALFFRDPPAPAPARRLLALGLLAGVGIWTHQLFAVYLAPFGVLALRTGLVRRPRFALFAAGGLAGALPVWLHELQHFPSSRLAVHDVGSVADTTVGERVAVMARHYAPALLGLTREEGPAVESLWLLAPVVGAVALLVARAACRDGAELAWTLGLGGRPARGAALLVWILVPMVALALLTQRGAHGARYLFPLFSVLPYWIGEGLAWLWRVRREVGIPALAAMLALQLWSNWQDTLGRTPPGERRWARLERDVRPLVEALDARGIRHVYWDEMRDLASYQVSYLLGRRIVAADPWREWALEHATRVDAADRPAFVQTRETDPGPLRDGLRALGLTVRVTEAGRFRLVEAHRDPGRGFVPLTPDGWRVTASHASDDAPSLLDRDAATGWRVGRQFPGQWLAVDLGRAVRVTRVDLLAVDWRDVPVGFRVEVSEDGDRWSTVAAVADYWGPLFLSEHHAFLKVRRGRVQAVFSPVRARVLRIVQTGTARHRGWAARELFVYGPADAGPPPPDPAGLAAALRREGVAYVYANHWLSAVAATASGGAARAQASNLYPNAFGRPSPDPRTLPPFDARAGRAVLLGSDADAAGVRAVLAARGIPVREAVAAGYRLLVLGDAPAEGWPLARDGWRAEATPAPEAASLVLDGDPATAWVARAPAGTAARLTLDLGAVHAVRRVRLGTGTGNGHPRAVALEGSTDGVAWEALGPLRWAGALYWTGSELLRNGADDWAVAFPPARVRYLRLSASAVAGGRPLAVHEIECAE